MLNNLINIAKFAKPHGIKGNIKIISYSANPRDIFNYKTLKDENNIEYSIKLISTVTDNSFICSFNNNSSRNLAEEICGTDLFIDKSQLADLKTNEYYHHDLIGIKIINENNENIGVIIEVQNFGAGDLIEIKLDKDNKTIYLPFDNNYILNLDLDKRILQFNFSEAEIEY